MNPLLQDDSPPERRITIVLNGPQGPFDVEEGDRFCNGLGWDEMLGQIAGMTMPAPRMGPGKGFYPMATAAEWAQRFPHLKERLEAKPVMPVPPAPPIKVKVLAKQANGEPVFVDHGEYSVIDGATIELTLSGPPASAVMAGAKALLAWADRQDADARAEGFGGGSQVARVVREHLAAAVAQAEGKAHG